MVRRGVLALSAAAVAAMLAAFPATAPAQTTSTFDTGTDGWTVQGDTSTAKVDPTFVPAGGNPGGYISITDAVSGGVMYWVAPPKFLGERSVAYGGRLSFDLRQSATTNPFADEDVILEGAGLVLVFDTSPDPSTAFTRYSVPLSEIGWHKGTLTGAQPTQAEFRNVLGGLTGLRIRAEYETGPDTDALDNPTIPARRATLADLAAPVLGKTTNVEPVRGEVFVGIRGAGASAAQKGVEFRPLEEARQIPVGSFLDTRRGTVRLQTARVGGAQTQQGVFARGLFQVLQSRKRSARGLTTLVLKGGSFRRCRASAAWRARGSAHAAAGRRVRRLRGNARGRFRTRGRHSAATVRGTVWTVTDRCDGTLTSVQRGRVAVRDFRRRTTIVVKAGKRYLARAPR